MKNENLCPMDEQVTVDQPVYRAVTEELLQEHLHCYCQPEPLKTAVQKSHSKEPEL